MEDDYTYPCPECAVRVDDNATVCDACKTDLTEHIPLIWPRAFREDGDKDFLEEIEETVHSLPGSGTSRLSTFLTKVAAIPWMEQEEEQKLFAIKAVEDEVEEDDEDKESLQPIWPCVTSHLRLAAYIAALHIGRGVRFFDLVEEGLLGLFLAASIWRCDDKEDRNFSDSAAYWIRQRIEERIKSQTALPQPREEFLLDLKNLKRAVRKLFDKKNRTPTADEVAADLGWAIDKVQEYLKLAQVPSEIRDRSLDNNAEELEEEKKLIPEYLLALSKHWEKLGEKCR